MKKFILILVLIKCIDGSPRLDLLVSTSKGLIRGLQAEDGDYTMFLGIPYALVDETNPFGAATPHPGFNDTYEAYHDNIVCPQTDNHDINTIQCLQLNIYVPNSASPANKLPVLVFIHGGSWVGGHKGKRDYSPKFLVRHDVVVISITYRVGPYGFLCLSEPGYNNQGLKDQILALKWIKDNISDFGGDVNSITAMGQSAGAMSIDILLLEQEGLFHRAILNSGTAISIWVVIPHNDTIPINIAARLGFEGQGVIPAIEYLSKIDSAEVIQAANDLNILQYNGHAFTRPCIEIVGEDRVLTDYPVNIKPKVTGIDVLIGHTNKEAMFIYPNSDPEFYRNYNFGDELAFGFDGVYDEEIVRHFYIGDEDVSQDFRNVILDYASDLAFSYPAKRSVDRYIDAGARNIYRYVFSYEGGRNLLKQSWNLDSEGASHADDLGYLFDMDFFAGEVPNEDDQRIIDIMTTTWTNFVKYGDPTPSTSDLITVKWLPVEPARRIFLSIDKNITLESYPFHERMSFWDLYYKLHADNERGVNGNRKNYVNNFIFFLFPVIYLLM